MSAEAAKAALEATLNKKPATNATDASEPAKEPVSEEKEEEPAGGSQGAPMLHGQAALDWLWAGKKDAPPKGAERFKNDPKTDPKSGAAAFQ
jgi:hypothetical protein